MATSDGFQFIMISAMYENGGNTTQRLLDGHPQLYSYPYESQLGSKYVQDYLSSLYPLKYRWPVFPLSDTAAGDYETIIDEECKVRIKTPQSSKFRGTPIDLSDVERKQFFVKYMENKERTRGNLIEAFFRATADAWKDYKRSGEERVYVGYSPIVGVDGRKIVEDLPTAHVLNIVRNPWSAYADTKKRAVPLSMEHYLTGWNIHQLCALSCRQRCPERVHILRYEDIIEGPEKILGDFLKKLGVRSAPTLATPSWNGVVRTEVYPWGTIRIPTPEKNRQTADELSAEEKKNVRVLTGPLLRTFDYETFVP
jgi:hypothetical protein